MCAKLDELGVQVKDFETGLLDFPAVRQGADVLLCWRVGEDAVDGGTASRSGFAGAEAGRLERHVSWTHVGVVGGKQTDACG